MSGVVSQTNKSENLAYKLSCLKNYQLYGKMQHPSVIHTTLYSTIINDHFKIRGYANSSNIMH